MGIHTVISLSALFILSVLLIVGVAITLRSCFKDKMCPFCGENIRDGKNAKKCPHCQRKLPD